MRDEIGAQGTATLAPPIEHVPSRGSGMAGRVAADFLSIGLAVADFLIVLLATLGTTLVLQSVSPFDGTSLSAFQGVDLLKGAVIVGLFFVTLLGLAGRYADPLAFDLPSEVRRATAIGGLGVGLIGLGLYGFAALDALSMRWVGLWAIGTLAGLVAVRGLFASILAGLISAKRVGTRVAIVGDWSLGAHLARRFAAMPKSGVTLAGVFSDADHGPRGRGQLLKRLRDERIDAVILAVPEDQEGRFRALYDALVEVPVDIHLAPDARWLRQDGLRSAAVGDVPTVVLARHPLAGAKGWVKAVEDRLVAGVITLGIAPILLLIALAIKFDSPGPALFRQRRRGYNNEIIEVLKFRTMYVERTDQDGQQLTQPGDPRITRLGRFLRGHSLDELPQFLNVLRGDMSIVGPRPHALASKAGGEFYEDAAKRYDSRHRMKPGITGLAQIRGWRGPTDTARQLQKRVEHDIHYIETWSLWLDLKIILQTAFKGFSSENAY